MYPTKCRIHRGAGVEGDGAVWAKGPSPRRRWRQVKSGWNTAGAMRCSHVYSLRRRERLQRSQYTSHREGRVDPKTCDPSISSTEEGDGLCEGERLVDGGIGTEKLFEGRASERVGKSHEIVGERRRDDVGNAPRSL